jgi:hypothetical protein
MELADSAFVSSAENPPYVRRSTWAIGLDIGQSVDPTALAAVEAVRWGMSAAFEAVNRHKSGAWVRAPGVTEIVAQRPRDELHVRALKRLPLGTPYPVQCEQIVALLSDPRLAGASVYLDRTGVGRPISDLFRKAGIPHIAVTITSGANEQQMGGDNLSVPKLHLISRLQAALHSGELKIARQLAEAAAFVRELQDFRTSFTQVGNLQFGARQGSHDDLVLAAALAVYGVSRPRPAMGVIRIGFAM